MQFNIHEKEKVFMRNNQEEEIDELRQKLQDIRLDQEAIRREGDAVEARLNLAIARATRTDNTVRTVRPLTVGDRIFVTNRVAPGRRNDQRGVITSISRTGRIYFTTDSGISTWRAPANVRHE